MDFLPLHPVVLIRIAPAQNNRLQQREMGDLGEILSQPSIAKDLLSPYSINQDGNFQGIFASGQYLLQNLFSIREHLHPLAVQFSIGIGEVSTPINSVMATLIEGKALENANYGLSQAPKSGNYFIMHGFSKSLERLMHPCSELLWASTRNWNLNRLSILNYKLRGHSEAQISELLHISERAIYKNIAEGKLGHWHQLILAIEENISRVLDAHKKSPSI